MPVRILSKIVILGLAVWAIYATASALMGITIYFPMRVGEQDKLFGSVTNRDIARALVAMGHPVDARRIVLDEPIKALGVGGGVIITVGSYYMGGLDAGNDLFLLSFLVLTLTIIRMDLQAGRLRSFMPTTSTGDESP